MLYPLRRRPSWLPHISEGNNLLECSTPRSNVSVGSGSTTQSEIVFDMNDYLLSGLKPRPWGTPDLYGISAGTATYGTIPTVDMTGNPRPAGYLTNVASLGCFEKHDTAGKQGAGANTDVGPGAYIYGCGDQIIEYGVDPISATPSIKVKYDANYGGTTQKPQVKLLASAEMGVAAQTLTMTAAVNTWQTLTFAPFTPAGTGAVKLQVVAKPDNANGMMFFDTLT